VRRIVVIVLSLVLLGPTMARASAWFRCAHDGELRSACCCPPAAKHHAAPGPAAALRAACCCTFTHIDAHASSVRSAPPATIAIAPTIAVATIATLPAREPAVQIAAIEHRAPRGPPDPLFARHCSLLL